VGISIQTAIWIGTIRFLHTQLCSTVRQKTLAPSREYSGGPGWIQYNLGYGYNELGTGWKDGNLRLGLGFTVEFDWNISVAGELPGPRTYIKLGDVRNPADLIAIGDGGGSAWTVPNIPGNSSFSLRGLHSGHGARLGRGKWFPGREMIFWLDTNGLFAQSRLG
jgi:hypothetical protein